MCLWKLPAAAPESPRLQAHEHTQSNTKHCTWGKMTLLPLVKVNLLLGLTRRVGPPNSPSPTLTSQFYMLLLVECGIDSTSTLLIQELRQSSSDSPSRMNKLDELFMILRRLPWTRRVVWTTRRVPPSLSLPSTRWVHSLTHWIHSTMIKMKDSGTRDPTRRVVLPDSPSCRHATDFYSILFESNTYNW